MAPRRPAAPTSRPTSADEIAAIMDGMSSPVLRTGITLTPDMLGSPWRENLRTAQQAILYSTSPGQPYAALTPDFVLLQRTSTDHNRIVQAIYKAYERRRFR